jgi:signal transduction histidine kinase
MLGNLKSQTATSDRVEAYKNIHNYYQHSAPDSALYYVTIGLNEFTAINDKNGMAAMTVLLAFNDATAGRVDVARARHTKALSLYEQTGNLRGIATAHNGLGILDGRTGNYQEAMKHFMIALKNFESVKDTDGIANTYMKVGIINEKDFILDKALEYYNKTLDLLELKPIKSMDTIFLYNNIGIVYAKKGDIKTALSYFERALKGSNKPDRMGVRIQTLNNLGIVFDKMGDDKKALYYFDEALRITKEKMPEDYARLSISRSSVVAKTKPQQAIVMLKEALPMVQKLGSRDLEADIYASLMDIYEMTGNYKEAFQTMKALKGLDDSLSNIEKTKEIMNLQSVHELDKTNARLARAEEKNKSTQLVRNIIIAVAIVLAAMLIVLLLQHRKTARLNAQLSKREAELQKTNDMKDKLFSIIGHDLRGPIGNIPVMLELLEDSSTTPDEHKYMVESLIAATKASTDTLDKLLYWGQAQIKGIGMKQVNFVASEHIQNNIQLINITAQQKQITIINNVKDNVLIHADPAHFDFIIRNLMSNAVKFTHNGGTITVNADLTQKQGIVVFTVTDTGIGIDASRLQEIFKPLGSSTRGTADEKGTSIGLMLCKEFVNENGGEIWVNSETDNGSTFSFTLKAAIV